MWRNRKTNRFLLLIILSYLSAGPPLFAGQAHLTSVEQAQILKRYAHDPQAFTQGLIFHQGKLYESTGLYGQSTLRQVDLETGQVQQLIRLPEKVFGEGLVLWKDKLIQLTWRAGVAFVFDLNTLKFEKQFRYATEGWGLTHDGKHLIMSDGSSTLYFRDPETFEITRKLNVSDEGEAVTRLNELEFVEGEVYANVWMTERIARISPQTGEVLAWLDFSGLTRQSAEINQQGNVLNGIAYDAKGKRLFVTGKRWRSLYEIAVPPAQNAD